MLSHQKEFNYAKSIKDLDPNILERSIKLNQYMEFLNAKAQLPHLNQPELCKHIKTSSSTLNKIRRDYDIKSPYRYNVPLHKNTKPKNFECSKCHTKYVSEKNLEKHQEKCLKEVKATSIKSKKIDHQRKNLR
jgi:hypothetical protein